MIEPVVLQDAIGMPSSVAFVLAMALVGVSAVVVVAFLWFVAGGRAGRAI